MGLTTADYRRARRANQIYQLVQAIGGAVVVLSLGSGLAWTVGAIAGWWE
jgi:hypothetical protein